MLLGTVVTLLAVLVWLAGAPVGLVVVAGALVQVMVLSYETVYVRAGQDVPLS